MELKVRFTIKGEITETTFFLIKKNEGLFLFSTKQKDLVPLDYKDGLFSLKNKSFFEESEEVISERMLGLSEMYLEAVSQGFDGAFDYNIDEKIEKPGYGPDDIYVENKPFSLQQIVDLINFGDIDITPNFQRNFVWDKTRQSRLIESILLGLPLPSIYFSQYDDGMLTVVDGLQRLHTINKFMKNELILSNLEYIEDCNGKNYEELKKVLSPLRLRRFGQTQIMCFVIDYRSPNRLKFDLFRRLNTGGKPLNNQEIRNCLSKPRLQKALYQMSHSDSFFKATDYSLKDTRMESQEAVLRFMYFSEQYGYGNLIGSYNGVMDTTLDDYIDLLNKRDDYSNFEKCYDEALKSSFYLFGRFCFRKVLDTSTRRPPINKSLMLCISVLLSNFSYEQVKEVYKSDELVHPLVELLNNNELLFQSLTWSTNSKVNIKNVMETLRDCLFTKLFKNIHGNEN